MCVKLFGCCCCCCGQPGHKKGRAKKRRKYDSSNDRRGSVSSSSDDEPAGSMSLRITSKHNGDKDSKALDTPKVNLMQPRTMKLLTDIGELKKGFHQNNLDEAQIQKNMTIHADILARLENPTGFA